jgi:hypothetical protein
VAIVIKNNYSAMKQKQESAFSLLIRVSMKGSSGIPASPTELPKEPNERLK